MDRSLFKKAGAYFKTPNQDLRVILAKVRELSALNNEVKKCLKSEWQPYCQVANLLGNKLILLVANGSLATQLRFETPDLLRKFRAHPSLQKIQDIQCKVRPPHPVDAVSQSKKPTPLLAPLSKESSLIVREIAAGLEDEKLRKVMERIASHIEED